MEKKHKPHIKAIIFDMDGTIIDSMHLWQLASKKVLENRGITNPPAHYQKEVENILSLKEWALITKQLLGIEDSSNLLVQELKVIVQTHFRASAKYINGFENFHAQITALNIPTGVATNCELQTLAVISSQLQFSNLFGTHVYSFEHAENKPKPDPAVFLHAAKMLGFDPSECLVFEDSLHGFRAAKAAGMMCVAVRNKKNHHLMDEVNHFIDDYAEALKTINHLIISDTQK